MLVLVPDRDCEGHVPLGIVSDSLSVADRRLDVLTAAAVALAGFGALVVSDEPGARPIDPAAAALLLVMAVSLAWRRRWPTSVVAIVSVVALVSFALGYPGGPPTIPLLVALYSVAVAGHRWWTVAVALLFAGGGLVFRAVVERESLVSITFNSALFVLVSLFGDAVHSRRKLAAETRERLRLADAEREAETQRQVTEERLRIARELHDVMAHSVTTLSVQAAAALDSFDAYPEQARSMLASMRVASRQAMQELRATVSLLREADDGQPTRHPAPNLEQLDHLVSGAEQAGLQVKVTTSGPVHGLPPAVELTAYRIVQEALTNVIRHADGSSVRVSLTRTPTRLTIQVDDDGRGPPAEAGGGFGLEGLRERVAAIGGTFRSGPAPARGFRLRAELPTGEEVP